MSPHRPSDSYQSDDVQISLLYDQGKGKQEVDGHDYPPQTAQESQRHPSDTSIPLFALYLRISEKHDRHKYEFLKGSIDSILVFCGLFSATLAALVVPSVTAQPPSPFPSLSIFNHDAKGVTHPSVYKVIPDDFEYGITFGLIAFSNLMLYFSLLLSIFCAVHALMLQRWAKPHTWTDSRNSSIQEQARMGAFFASRIDSAEKAITIIHFVMLYCILVFFTGLFYYLYGIDLYSFSFSVFLGVSYYSYLFYQQFLPYLRHKIRKFSWRGSPHSTRSTPEKNQEQRSDGEILKRTLDMTRSDGDDLEQFLEAIPGFCTSAYIVRDPRPSLKVLGLPRLAATVIGFWNCTLSCNRFTESVKVRRLVVCARVIEAAELSDEILDLLGDRDGVLRSFEMGHSRRRFRNRSIAPLSRGIIAGIISSARRDDRWYMLAMREWGISKGVIQEYGAHGHSVLLFNLIYITRHFFRGLLQPHPDLTREALCILSWVSKINILYTRPELQHDFCALWNDVVQHARKIEADDNPFVDILVEIRHLYTDLHGADVVHDDLLYQPASYPLCTTPGHHHNSTIPTEEVNTIDWASQTSSNTAASLNLPEPPAGGVLQVPRMATV